MGFAWSPDGKLLATSNEPDRRIAIFDHASQKALHTIERLSLMVRMALNEADHAGE